MSSDDKQPIMDVLGTVSTELRRYSSEVAGFVDENFDRAAEVLREQLVSATWLPEIVRNQLPQPRPPVEVEVLPVLPDMTLLERTQDWVLRHKVLASFMVLAAGTMVFRTVRRAQSGRRVRRARRARNGARCEVVVVAASPMLPITQSLALDFERRGYVVYVVSGSAEDEQAVRQLARPDVRPLSIDITDAQNTAAALERFALYLHSPHAAVPGAKRSHLTLTAVILIPSLSYQTSPIATIPPANFAELFNTHLLQPILTIRAFLPLLTARTALQPGEKPPPVLATAASKLGHLKQLSLESLRRCSKSSKSSSKTIAVETGAAAPAGKATEKTAAEPTAATTVAATATAAPAAASATPSPPPPPPKDKVPTPPKVLVFTPSIISSVNPPFHAPEATVCSALSAFTEVLAAELGPLAIPVTHVQLGTFDFSGFAPARSVTAHHSHGERVTPPSVETLSWPEPVRHVYGRNYMAQSASALGSGRAIRGLRGTSMRDLHHAVFDVLDGTNKSAVVRVGLGADFYGFVGSFVPHGLVAWMMGVRKVDDLGRWYQPAPGVVGAAGSAAGAAGVSSSASVVSVSSDISSAGNGGRQGSKRGGDPNDSGFVAVDDDEVIDAHVWQ